MGFHSLHFLKVFFFTHESSPIAQLLYQEYSDVVLNKEIQSQQRLNSLAEAPGLASPRQRRKAMVSSDSYLQRLSMASSGSLWQEIPMVRNSTVLLSMTHEDQKLQEVPPRAGGGGTTTTKSYLLMFCLLLTVATKSRLSSPRSPLYMHAHCHAEECELLSESEHSAHFPHSCMCHLLLPVLAWAPMYL